MAELVAAAVADPSIAENKILEVVAEETAPLRQAPFLILLSPDLHPLHSSPLFDLRGVGTLSLHKACLSMHACH